MPTSSTPQEHEKVATPIGDLEVGELCESAKGIQLYCKSKGESQSKLFDLQYQVTITLNNDDKILSYQPKQYYTKEPIKSKETFTKTDVKNAEKCKKDIITYRKDIEASGLKLGIKLITMRNNKYWKALDYHSWSAFLDSPEIDISRATANRCMVAVNEFVTRLGFDPVAKFHDAHTLIDVGITKLAMIAESHLADSKTDANDWLVKALVLSKSDLRKEIREAKGLTVRDTEQFYRGNLSLKDDRIVLTTSDDEQKDLKGILEAYPHCRITATIKILSDE